MKNLTRTLIYLFSAYAVACFITAELDFRKWEDTTRAAVLFLAAIIAFADFTVRENTKK